MSSISNGNVDQVLAEMRRLAAAAQGSAVSQAREPVAAESDFSTLLKQSVEKVNSLQASAGKLSTAFSAGDPGVDVAEVMVALQKAGVAFQAMTEVRNRLVKAYQEIMSMQV
ncbi:MAG TPA: flagellar hook-basal body complex protein FliE [Gammaproteobacteria bacterium]|nr:flagellar hook-basal body complex protein FliE [Gammaproteobacteria bacterium]